MSPGVRHLLLVAVVLFPAGIAAQGLPGHATFDTVLARHVRGPLVDYAALRQDSAGLVRYLEQLAAAPAEALDQAPRATRLPFWINAYNACALRLVTTHYPIKKRGFPASLGNSLAGVPANSIRQIPDTWSRRFCPVAGEARSLDQIEHDILRPMGDPRIHFAVNCASRSCPVLAPEAYRPDALEAQLQAAVDRFVTDSAQYRLEPGSPPVLRLNKVLDWYGSDFASHGGPAGFLLRYLPPADRAVLEQHGPPRIVFEHYDWTLNDTAVFERPPGADTSP